MQSNLLRGARRLLVAAGVITLVCSVVAPAAVSASNAGGIGQGAENGQAGEHGQGQGAENGQAGEHGLGQGGQNGQGQGGQNGQAGESGQGRGGEQDEGGEQGAEKVWVCHRTAADEVNPFELVEVSVNAKEVHADHHEDRWFTEDADLAALLEWATTAVADGGLGLAELQQSSLQQLDPEQVAALAEFCTAEVDEDVVEEVVEDDTDDTDDTGDDDDDTGDDDDSGDDDESGDPKPIRVSDDVVAPPAPLPEPQISADHVVAPVVETPAPAGQPEVLGVTTTRTPTGELASTTGITSLPRTGADSTTILALVGGLLVATGVGLEALGRRGHLAAVGGRR